MVNMDAPSGPANMLLVEGPNDKHVIIHLRQRHMPMPEFCISVEDGVENLLSEIEPQIRVPGRRALGIVVDADDDIDARWQSISGRLNQFGVETPAAPNPSGIIIPAQNGMPRVGVWIMPDNQSPGELEDFIQRMIPGGDPVWPLSEAYIDGIPAAHRKFAEGKALRAKVNAWLAARERPRPMGLAVGAGDLNAGAAIAGAFAAWLAVLFA